MRGGPEVTHLTLNAEDPCWNWMASEWMPYTEIKPWCRIFSADLHGRSSSLEDLLQNHSVKKAPEGRKKTVVYIPEHFRVRDHADAIAFMNANPFAILVSSTDEGPLATHLPLFVREAEGHLLLRGHVAKANPHWRHLERQSHCLTIFHGPHAFVSTENYTTRETVPTWNYGAVHIYGNARLFSSAEELQGMLHELIATFQPPYAEQWAELSETYRERMLSHIVGFEIAVAKIEAKFKLSQNRAREEQANVIASLEKAEDTTVSGVARLMREQGLGVKKR